MPGPSALEVAVGPQVRQKLAGLEDCELPVLGTASTAEAFKQALALGPVVEINRRSKAAPSGEATPLIRPFAGAAVPSTSFWLDNWANGQSTTKGAEYARYRETYDAPPLDNPG